MLSQMHSIGTTEESDLDGVVDDEQSVTLLGDVTKLTGSFEDVGLWKVLFSQLNDLYTAIDGSDGGFKNVSVTEVFGHQQVKIAPFQVSSPEDQTGRDRF